MTVELYIEDEQTRTLAHEIAVTRLHVISVEGGVYE